LELLCLRDIVLDVFNIAKSCSIKADRNHSD
jgi:hypothetical protein